MITDFHTHIFSPEIVKNLGPFLDDMNLNRLYNSKNSRIIDHNMLIKKMDESNIDYAVAMGFSWQKSEYCKRENEYFIKMNDDSGGRIIPFASLPLSEENKIEMWIKEASECGFKGIGEIAFYNDGMNERAVNSLEIILNAAQRYSMPVCLHVNEPIGHSYNGKYDPDLSSLYSLIRNYSETTVILSHWGGGILFYELMPEVAKAFKNVYYDTAASPFIYRDEVYELAVKILGSGKILFGSDFPLINFSRYINAIEKSSLTEEDKANIMGLNSMKILNM